MANSNRRAIFVACLLFASLSLANSDATCPLDVVLRMESCSKLVDWLLNGGDGTGNPLKAQCCNVIGGLDEGMAADCLCEIIKGDVSGNYNNANVDSTLGSVFGICQKEEPAGYQCVA